MSGRQHLVTLALVSFIGITQANAAKAEDEAAVVISELAHRSGLSIEEVKETTGNCNANQQSMYFCAWRDLIANQRAVDRELASKSKSSPSCKSELKKDVTTIQQRQEQTCNKAAKRSWGKGSMKETDRLVCLASSTKDLAARILKAKDCERLK